MRKNFKHHGLLILMVLTLIITSVPMLPVGNSVVVAGVSKKVKKKIPKFKDPKHTIEYRFDGISQYTDENGEVVKLKNVVRSDTPKIVYLTGTIHMDQALWLGSNTTIIATGATIIQTEDHAVVSNFPKSNGYNSLRHVLIDGGKWKYVKKNGYDKTMMRFCHASDICVRNVYVECSYKGHSVELIGCKNVWLENSKLKAVGSKDVNKDGEEQLQIDLAAPASAPFIGKEYQNGLTCKNIYVNKCTINGGRGISTNCDEDPKGYPNKFHENVIIQNSTVIGNTCQGMFMCNCIGLDIEKCTIKSTLKSGKRWKDTYSTGLYISMYGNGKTSKAMKKKGINIVRNNKIYGGQRALYIISRRPHDSYKKSIVEGNKCYNRLGKDEAYTLKSSKKTINKKNKKYDWK